LCACIGLLFLGNLVLMGERLLGDVIEGLRGVLSGTRWERS
jgi:hypothetical protein